MPLPRPNQNCGPNRESREADRIIGSRGSESYDPLAPLALNSPGLQEGGQGRASGAAQGEPGRVVEEHLAPAKDIRILPPHSPLPTQLGAVAWRCGG